MQGVLKDIVENKIREVEQSKKQFPLAALKALCQDRGRSKDFYIALASLQGARVIAECKRKSPSKGLLVHDYDPVRVAKSYERGGAAAISVLTDEVYFGGCLQDLEEVADAVSIPVLRKDFIIDEYQIYEAYRSGASSFLLLASVLEAVMIQYFLEVGRDLGMEALVEVHSGDELAKVFQTDAKIVGVNARDLKSMSVDLAHGGSILNKVPEQERKSRLFVLESGISTTAQIQTGLDDGFRGFLIGESLITSKDPEAVLKSFLIETRIT